MERYKNQSDIFTPIDIPIHIIGIRGIGSWTAFILAKMGCQDINLYDFDEVEDHNIASQIYKEDQIGLSKQQSLQQNIKDFSGINCSLFSIEQEINIRRGIVIIAVDSMEERIKLYNIFKDKDVFIIDGRMGGLQLEIYNSPASQYNETLVDPNNVEPDACTAKSICFNCAIIGGLIANFVRQYLQGTLPCHQVTFGFNDLMLLKK